jgi:hypothetical protein
MHGQTIPPSAFVHATQAVAIGPPSAALFHDVAMLYATAARKDPAAVRPAIEYVGKSVELGCKPEAFASNARYSALQKNPAFRAALLRPVSTTESSPVVQLVDPLDRLK